MCVSKVLVHEDREKRSSSEVKDEKTEGKGSGKVQSQRLRKRIVTSGQRRKKYRLCINMKKKTRTFSISSKEGPECGKAIEAST